MIQGRPNKLFIIGFLRNASCSLVFLCVRVTGSVNIIDDLQLCREYKTCVSPPFFWTDGCAFFFTLFWNKKTLRALNYFLLVLYDFQCSCFSSKLKTYGYSSPSWWRPSHGFSLRNRGIWTTISVFFKEYFSRFSILCLAELFGIY